jgi:hypothetical protein
VGLAEFKYAIRPQTRNVVKLGKSGTAKWLFSLRNYVLAKRWQFTRVSTEPKIIRLYTRVLRSPRVIGNAGNSRTIPDVAAQSPAMITDGGYNKRFRGRWLKNPSACLGLIKLYRLSELISYRRVLKRETSLTGHSKHRLWHPQIQDANRNRYHARRRNLGHRRGSIRRLTRATLVFKSVFYITNLNREFANLFLM